MPASSNDSVRHHAKTSIILRTLQGTVKGTKRRGGQSKRWEDNIKTPRTLILYGKTGVYRSIHVFSYFCSMLIMNKGTITGGNREAKLDR